MRMTAAEVEITARALCSISEPDPMQQDFDTLMSSTKEHWRGLANQLLGTIGPMIAARIEDDIELCRTCEGTGRCPDCGGEG